MYRTIPITFVHAGGPVMPPRRGSTLMIVIVLMGLLAVLGVLFYTIAAQERSNAEYFSDAAKNQGEPGLSADVLFDHALQQLVVSTDPRLKNSVLWGSRHSMIANMAGVKDHKINDLTLFDGQGVVVGVNDDGTPIVDYNHDGIADTGNVVDSNGQTVNTSNGSSDPQDLLGMNDSPAANGLFERETGRFPQPDVGYTYPDINNPFLAYVGFVRDRNSPNTIRRVIIPSFHRPQLYRDSTGEPIPLWEDLNYNGTIDTMPVNEDRNGNGMLDAGATTPNQLFRPHRLHVDVPPGQRSGAAPSRYISTAADAQAFLGDAKRVFPFLPMYPGYNPTGGASITLNNPPEWIGHQGVWSGPHPTDSGYANATLTPTYAGAPSGITLHDDVQYDVDNDNDGIREGVWLDLDFPVQELPDGTLFVPMFSITVHDLDALINLNAHGNIQNLLFTFDSSGPNGMKFNNTSDRFGYNYTTGAMDFISASNMGMMPSEINPAWALTGRPGIECGTGSMATVFLQHERFFGNPPTDISDAMAFPPPSRNQLLAMVEVANMELANLKMGRPELNGSGSVDDLTPGLYGEEGLIARHLGGQNNSSNLPASRTPLYFPHPGQSLNDDNNDLYEHMNSLPQNTGGATRVWLEVEHPFDPLGLGTNLVSSKFLNRTNLGGTSRVHWLQYYDYANNGTSPNGNVFWGQNFIQTGQLMRNATGNPVSTFTTFGQPYGLYDDPSEVALWPTDRRDIDDPFMPEDAVFLAMSNSEITTQGFTSRLEDLASFNFSANTSTNARGEAIRKRFTTVANDRKNFAAPRAVGAGGRNWEWTDDQGQNASTGGSKLRFPPTFGDAGSAIPRFDSAGLDPFRPAVRYLLQTTRDDLQAKQFQQRLAVNQLLYYDPQTNELKYRELTPHPLDPGAAAVPVVSGLRPALAQLSAAQQEAWARRDRQQLARDIYVLLYLLGSGQTGTNASNPTRTSWMTGTPQYSDEQLEQMARFAVNLIDAQDRDNVITRFEYDTDLSDGWNLNDNPYPPAAGDTASDRAEVWGVERQELALSEFIVVNCPTSSPRGYTSWDDNANRQFFCLELRNVAPYRIKFSDVGNDVERWQLMVRQETAAPDPTKWRLLTLKNTAGQIDPGGFYTIFSTDRDEPTTNPSMFQVDPAGGSALQPIIPSDATFTGNASGTGSYIDLVKEYTNNLFEITAGNSSTVLNTAGALLNDGTPGGLVFTDASVPVEVILRRRAHPTRMRPNATISTEVEDNPWIEVDRISADLDQFDPMSSANLTTELDELESRERREILSRSSEGSSTAAAPTRNTFKFGPTAENSLVPPDDDGNAMTPERFGAWQAHFDREFTSIGDLLHVPLFGPPPYDPTATNYGRKDSQTLYFGTAKLPPTGASGTHQYGEPQTSNLPPGIQTQPAEATFQNYAKTALGMFAAPNHPTQGNQDGTPGLEDNRWHRVLEFLEVPTRQHRNIGMGSTFNISRVAGKINPNTVRHPEVLGALIDDERVATLNLVYPDPSATPVPQLTDSNYPHLDGVDTSDTGREWFEQLQNSRDPVDPYWYGLATSRELRLPGLALNTYHDTSGSLTAVPDEKRNGFPFRSFGYADDPGTTVALGGNIGPNRAIEHTLLRSLPADSDQTASQRRLFEVGNETEHQGGSLDPVVRHRILSKMIGNTTVRSNSYVVFMTSKLFRAYIDPTTGATRIGGPVREYGTPFRDLASDPSPELPEYRGVFIIDRSKLEDGVSAGGGSGVTSFAPFVVYRKVLEE